MKTYLMSITIISILVFAPMAYAGDYFRGKNYVFSSGYYGPSAFSIYSDDERGVTVYVINGYGRYYKGYNKYYRGDGRYYKGFGKYNRASDRYYYKDFYYGKQKTHKFLRNRPYKFGHEYKGKYYNRGYNYRTPRYRGYR
jgi:hypothetical protein